MGEIVPASIANEPEDLLTSIATLPRGSVVLLLGDVDTGKSTLARRLVDRVDRAALLDTDVGQGTLAPPTAIGAAIVEGGKSWTIGQWFVGAVSPVRHMRELCEGAGRLLTLARRQNPEIVVVDTCGLVRGRVGVGLKTRLIRALRPDVVIASARSQELDSILRSIPAGAEIIPQSPVKMLLKTTPSIDVRRKTASYRRRVRAERLAAALDGARPLTFGLVDPSPDLLAPLAANPLDFAGLLTGLIDRNGLCLGIALLDAVAADGSSITLSTLVRHPDRVAALQFGDLILASNGATVGEARAIPAQIPVAVAQPYRGKSR